MTHLQELMIPFDRETGRILKTQLLNPHDPRYGGFVKEGYHVDPRDSGFMMAHVAVSYICRESRFYLDPQAELALKAAFCYMRTNLRPSGCVDLTGCNFDSAPDTAFTANELISAWWLLEKRLCHELQWMVEPFKALLTTMAQGIADGGFHTPNHRWAISACLKCVAKIADRPDFSERADEYLNEGIDINGYGEYAERSAGTYNQVNDDQMIRLYLATGDQKYLEYVRRNLKMMIAYIDPDDTIFTNNSTRQDQGRKVYLNSYYIWFLLAGYFLKDDELLAMAEYCYRVSTAQGRVSYEHTKAAPWMLLFEDLETCTQKELPDVQGLLNYCHVFPESQIARMRRGSLSMTVMEDKPNFLYVQNGAFSMYMVIHSQICANCNFLPQKIEPMENGFRAYSSVTGWYYLPFYPQKPDTSDWWAMDNPHTRRKMYNVQLNTTVEAVMDETGVTVKLSAVGYTGIPLRVELGFLPCRVRHECFVTDGLPGGHLVLTKGKLELTGSEGDVLTVENGFAEHASLARRDSAYLQSSQHYTVYLTGYTPVEKTFRIGTQGFGKKDLLNWEK